MRLWATSLRSWLAMAAAGALSLTASAQSLPTSNRPPPSCWEQTFEGDAFVVCRYRPETDELRLAWRGRGGKPLGSLPALKAHLGKDRRRVLFAMNAGMYDPARRPVGLFVQDTRLVQPLNAKDGQGNFFMKPNGVFWVEAAGQAHLDETGVYAHDPGLPMWATQSGPMLVIAGEVNPRLQSNGASRYVRNAVGVTYTGAFFVMSRKPVSLGRLARFMRDELSCLDALYLDGAVSSLWSPDLGRLDRRSGLGPMVVVLARP